MLITQYLVFEMRIYTNVTLVLGDGGLQAWPSLLPSQRGPREQILAVAARGQLMPLSSFHRPDPDYAPAGNCGDGGQACHPSSAPAAGDVKMERKLLRLHTGGLHLGLHPELQRIRGKWRHQPTGHLRRGPQTLYLWCSPLPDWLQNQRARVPRDPHQREHRG